MAKRNGKPAVPGSIGDVLAAMKSAETYGLPPGVELRAWQQVCLAEFRKKHRTAGASYFTFLIASAVAAGKTIMAAQIAAYLRNTGVVDRVVYVCPTRIVCDDAVAEFRKLNLELVVWDKGSHSGGEPRHVDGLVMTYSALILCCETQGRLCDLSRTLVIFDEIHHLGERLSWGEKARAAFEFRAACVLGLSGTPYRGDNREIPFVVYEPVESDGLKIFRADYTYTLGRAIHEGVCCKPILYPLEADVNVTFPDKVKRVVNFKEKLPIPLANRRLTGAVLRGSASRSQAIHRVLEFCRGRHRLIIFVGGDSLSRDGGGVRDATEFLPAELRAFGVKPREMCIVVSDDKESKAKIKAFGKSDAWILICVNMVSEGANIPELSAALFLTSITAKSTTEQRIGRILRGQGEAHVFAFADERYVAIFKEIEAQHLHEIDLGKNAPLAAPVGPSVNPPPDREPMAIGLNCKGDGMIIGGVWYPDEYESGFLKVARKRNWPESTAFRSVIVPMIAEGLFPETGLPAV